MKADILNDKYNQPSEELPRRIKKKLSRSTHLGPCKVKHRILEALEYKGFHGRKDCEQLTLSIEPKGMKAYLLNLST